MALTANSLGRVWGCSYYELAPAPISASISFLLAKLSRWSSLLRDWSDDEIGFSCPSQFTNLIGPIIERPA